MDYLLLETASLFDFVILRNANSSSLVSICPLFVFAELVKVWFYKSLGALVHRHE